MQRISQSGTPEPMEVLCFWIDSRTDQLEYLVAAVQTIKGSCCFGEK